MNIFIIINISRHIVSLHIHSYSLLSYFLSLVYLVYSCHAFIVISWYLVYSWLGYYNISYLFIFLYLFIVYLSASCIVCGFIVSDIIVVLGKVALFVLLGYLLNFMHHHVVSHCNHMYNLFML